MRSIERLMRKSGIEVAALRQKLSTFEALDQEQGRKEREDAMRREEIRQRVRIEQLEWERV